MQQVSQLQLKQPYTTGGKQRNICCLTPAAEQRRLRFKLLQHDLNAERQQQVLTDVSHQKYLSPVQLLHSTFTTLLR